MFFISVGITVECVLLAVIYAVLLGVCFIKHLGIMQSAAYSGRRYMKWLAKKGNLAFARVMLLVTAIAFSSAVLALCFAYLKEYAAVVSLAAYLIFLVTYIVADRKIALRSPATFTPRLKRLTAVFILLLAISAYILVALLNFVDNIWGNDFFTVLRYVPMAILPLVAIPVLLFANLICKAYELPHNKRFIKAAQAKLAKNKVTVVGITGSFAKTSVKFILSDILKSKYNVLATPRSHNTPMGVALAINKSELDKVDIFVAEMGARNVGDIAELCELFPPDYALITGICPQHLESFLTVENIIEAKGEIIAPTHKKIFVSKEIATTFKGEKISVSDTVSEIEADMTGCSFTLTLGGKSKRVHSKLLGEHSARNIGLAASLAKELGVSFEEICTAIEGLDYIEHRLQLIESGGVHILDDGYNSNIKGAEAAIGVLKMFTGKKLVVTPGLVELGVLEKTENYALGEKLVGLDMVILVGDTLISDIKNGYLAAGGEAEKLKIANCLNEAQQMLKEYIQPNDTVLFLNDLPDLY